MVERAWLCLRKPSPPRLSFSPLTSKSVGGEIVNPRRKKKLLRTRLLDHGLEEIYELDGLEIHEFREYTYPKKIYFQNLSDPEAWL